MAVPIEAISVVIRAEALLAAFDEDWEAFVAVAPNRTLCADGELVRVGFMTPDDVQAFVALLEGRGLVYVRDGRAVDLNVVDQQRGPMTPCDWLECGHMHDREKQQNVAACRLIGGEAEELVVPPGWDYAHSLSRSFGFVPDGSEDRSLRFLRHENGMDVYLNLLTGEEVYVARSGPH